MGHTRLGLLPKTRKWNRVVEIVAGRGLESYSVANSASHIDVVAAQALNAASATLTKAGNDAGVRYSFYLLTQLALASRSQQWRTLLARHGINLRDESTIFDLTAELQAAIDRHISDTSPGATDFSEMAQQATGEALTSLLGSPTFGLFESTEPDDLKNAVRSLSSKRGFAQLGQRFFSRFIARFLNFYLSRATAGELGAPRLQNLGDIGEFNAALTLHCEESARIVRDFCGDWYSKTNYAGGIDLSKSSRFLAVAVRKLRNELQLQGSDS